ncbi:GCN5 family acetyltransferase [Aeromicrobium sp. Root495]|uniref:GNAT family N-acetyltransferase n=1 Tax=Aeromicrobium sp. Root495 TaxID=1736550 RepID=UPI0006F7787C|nr:GNAT family N-acetyltransferase [Aeromicrobium sp. Root495]KQY60173.1 GCN5 family acetyltransferase [Aeromicrobium sp. Root495]RYJ03595.1 MAG: GNAT family N-acetyltransferase [Actinomycetales bacterium]
MPTYPAGVREATPDDVETIVQLVRDLAEYEREPEAAQATPEQIHAALFGPESVASCFMAEVDGAPAGMALWYRTFSTWTGLPGIHLEDLFVLPEHRGSGLGKALLVALSRICLDRGWPRLEWDVLDWNEPSIAFYDRLGALPQDTWIGYRLSGDALSGLAGS